MIKFICTKCNHKIGAPEKYAGKRVHCPKCKTPLQVPNSVEKTDSQEQNLIRFRCAGCNQKFAVSADYAGKRVRCSKCKNALRVPNLEKEPLEKELAVNNVGFDDIFQDDTLTDELLSAEASAPPVEEPLKVKPPSPEPPSTQPQSFDGGPYISNLPHTFDSDTATRDTKGASKIFLALSSGPVKILAILMLVIFAIWGIGKIIGIDFSVSLDSITEEEDGGMGLYEIWTKAGSYKDIIGASLPETATDVHGSTLTRGCHGGYILPRCSWIVATLPEEDFYDLVEKTGLVSKPDLLEFWPKAFDCHQEDFQQFWGVENVVNEHTYFGKESGEETWRVFKYEDGKIYIKKVTRYVAIGFADGQARYEKKGPAAIEYILGAPLSGAAADIDVFSYGNFGKPHIYMDKAAKASFWFWAVAKLPREDFASLVEQLKSYKNPDLLEIWPDAFDMARDDVDEKWGYNGFWDVTDSVNEDTYYREDTKDEARLLLKYENGSLYIKKEVVYIRGKDRYWKKAKRDGMVPSYGHQEPQEEEGLLFPIVRNGKYGFINKSGEVVIKPQFHSARDFSEGLAMICVKRKGHYLWGYIGKTGRIVIDPQFANIEVRSGNFSEGLARVMLDRKYGYIDKTGQMVIEPQFEPFGAAPRDTGAFCEGLACIRLDGKYGYIDKAGQIVIEPEFETFHIGFRFSEGLVRAQFGRKWGYLNKSGEVAIEPQFDGARDFSEGLAAVKIGGRMGFIDKTGSVVIEPQFSGWEFISGFSEGLARVWISKKWCFIDRKGGIVIELEPRLGAGRDFSEGRALVSIGYKESYKAGYIDKAGKVVVEPQFDYAQDFSEGLARVSVGRKKGYIDKMGNYVWEPTK